MRNIVQIDFNDMNNCGVLNSASSESSILLCITPEARQKTSLKVEITGSNGEVLTSPELMAAGGMVRYEADREYWTEAGTMKVRVLSGEGDSGYAEFQIIEDMSEGSAQVKQKSRSEIMFEVNKIGREKETCNCISVYMTKTKSVTGELLFDAAKIIGDAFAFENGRVIVKKDIKRVRCYANIGGAVENSSNRIWVLLLVNNQYPSPKLDSICYSSPYGTASFAGIVDVKKGDKISVNISEKISVNNAGIGCSMTIEAIE